MTVGPVAHGGHCVARYEGRVIFVRHTLPGERVRALVTEGREHDRFLRADAVEVLDAAPDRVERPCPYAGPGRCGGCDWQHVALPAQRRLKAAVIEEQLARLARLEWSVTVEPVSGDQDGLGWRSRVHYAIADDGRAGLRRHRSHQVEPIGRCRIASSGVVELGVTGRRWNGVTGVEAIAAAGTGETALVVTPPGPEPGLAVHEHAVGRTWRVSGGGFWQVHPGAAETLVGAVLDGLHPQPGERALDLYAGVGLFAGALALALGPEGRVTAVEADRQAVSDARHNLRDLRSIRIERGDVGQTLPRLPLERVDLVVLDPPRSGAGRRVVDAVSALSPRAIAYVACDPAALARDISWFGDRGYVLSSLRAYDIFPMTFHTECVAVLVKRAGQEA